jgi:HEAT repeat protein
MPELNEWMKLFRSTNPIVRKRALEAILKRDEPELCPFVLSVFIEYYCQGFGVALERWLSAHKCPGAVDAMIPLLKHKEPYLREAACRILGSLGDRKATWPLVDALSDRRTWVRREAAFALASLCDPESADAIKARYAKSRKDDINVRAALECALQELGIDFEEWPV